jgi:hypothetical protein
MDARNPSNEKTRSFVGDGKALAGLRVLVFWDGGFTWRDLAQGQSVVIGRSVDCDIHVLHTSVSRRHVSITAGPPLRAADLGSANGTRVGGQLLGPNEECALEPGVVVEAGAAMIVVQSPREADLPAAHASSTTSMAQLDRLVELVAGSGLSVVLIGETGVGKEVTAERIHRSSARAKSPFVRLNCAALPETLLESELFGYERGAFTGAVRSKPGLLETAAGGTVFLDEIA